jgi:hypothetical protein
MFGRVIAACLFLAGGLLTWFVLTGLHGVVASQAGISAGPVPRSPDRDAALLWLLSSYFLVSTVSAVVARKKRVLWALWSFAHALVLIAFCVLCSEASGWDREKFVSGILMLAVVTGVFLSPWLVIWALLMRSAKRE